jgi:hypothetical protein
MLCCGGVAAGGIRAVIRAGRLRVGKTYDPVKAIVAVWLWRWVWFEGFVVVDGWMLGL